MSVQPEQAGIPAWDLADRLRKALRQSGLSVGEMADYLDVSRTSVSNWINGRIEPRKQTIRLWALRCGVDYSWLCHGDKGPCFDESQAGVSAGQRRVITGSYSHRVSYITAAPPFLPVAA